MSRTLVTPHSDHLAEVGVTRVQALKLGRRLDLSPNTIAKIFDSRPVSVASLKKLSAAFPQVRFDDLVRNQARPNWQSDISEIRRNLRQVTDDSPLRCWVARQILRNTAGACGRMAAAPPQIMSEAKFLSWIKVQFLTEVLLRSRLEAVCGKKAWGHPYVRAYFEANFLYAKRLGAVEKTQRTRVRRIFIEPVSGFSAEEKETINRHVECRDHGVEAWLLPASRHGDMGGSVLGLQRQLLDEGLGLLFFSTKTKKAAVTHTMHGDEMAVCHFEHPYAVLELSELYSSLRDIAEQIDTPLK